MTTYDRAKAAGQELARALGVRVMELMDAIEEEDWELVEHTADLIADTAVSLAEGAENLRSE